MPLISCHVSKEPFFLRLRGRLALERCHVPFWWRADRPEAPAPALPQVCRFQVIDKRELERNWN